MVVRETFVADPVERFVDLAGRSARGVAIAESLGVYHIRGAPAIVDGCLDPEYPGRSARTFGMRDAMVGSLILR